MSTTIQPAIPTPEWEAQLARSPEERRRALLCAKDEADADGYLTIHGLAALALHGQPFGFTWEDVDLLYRRMTRTEPRPIDDQLRDLAARIAALLPPREAE